MTMPAVPRIRSTDISGLPYQPPSQQNGLNGVLTVRPPQFEPPDGSTEFLLSFSAQVPGGVQTPLFTLDANQNPVIPSCAIQLPPNAIARINAVEISGDTGAVSGAPVLIFSIRTDRSGQVPLPGWTGVGLPGRGGIVSVGFEPFTRVLSSGTFFGGFVNNVSGGPLFAEMIMTGWFWIP